MLDRKLTLAYFSSSLNNKDWENIPLQVRSYTRVGLDREELQRKVVKSVGLWAKIAYRGLEPRSRKN